jgi:hypothetical protein
MDPWLSNKMMKAKENHRQIMKAERMVKADRDLNAGAVMSVAEAHSVVKSMNQFISPNAPSSMADIHLPKAQYISPGIGIESYEGSRFAHHDMGHKSRMRVGYGDRPSGLGLGESGSSAIKIKSATLGR